MSNTPHKWNYNFPQIAREYGLNLSGAESGIIDWRFIGTYDVEKLIRENDFERLEAAIPHLSEAPLGTILNTSVLDSGISKYFCLAQLGLQYLSFCKDFLDKAVSSLRRNVYSLEKEKQNMLKTYRRQNEELLRMHKKVQRNEMHFEKRGEVYPCRKCTKNFVTSELLNNHVQRKHADFSENVENDNHLLSNIKLELEIKQLKEKLNHAENDLAEYRKNNSQKTIYHSFGMQTNFEEEKEKDETVEIQSHRQMLLDSQYQLADLLKAQISALDEWKESEKKRYEKETEEIKSSFQEAFNFMSQKRRIVLNKTKLDLYSIPAENARPEKQTNEFREQTLNNEWEKKYKDLEINYKDSYEKMSFILSKLDKKNKDQLLLIEELRKKPETRNFSIQVNLNKIHSSKVSKIKIEEFPKEELVISNPVSDKVLIRKSSKENISHTKNIKRTRNEVLELINSKMQDVGLKPNQSCIKTEDFEKIKLNIDQKRKEKIRKFSNFQTTRENILHSLNFEMQNFTKDHTTHDEELSNKILNKFNYDVSLFDDTHSSGRIFDRRDGSSQESRDKKLTKNKKVNFDCDKNGENDEISFYDKYLESRKNMYQISTDTDNE